MTSDPKISVIIPVHNTGVLLHDSIGSIATQTMHDIQIVCVDDASDDDETIRILGEYRDSDNRIDVIRLDTNVGAGGARNAGIKAALGKYIITFDSDDFALPDMLESMYELCEIEDLDMAICGSYNVDSVNKGLVSAMLFKEKEGVTDRVFNVSELGDYALSSWDTAPWNKLIKKSMIEKKKISFQEISSCNDVYYSVMCALESERIMYCKNGRPLVEYRVGRKEQISSNRSPIDLVRAFKKIINDTKPIKDKVEKMLVAELVFLGCGELMSSAEDSEKRVLYQYIRDEIIRTNCIEKLEKGRIRDYCTEFVNNSFDSKWFLENETDIFEIDKIRNRVDEPKPVCIWGYGKKGLEIDKLLHQDGKYQVIVTDKKNIMVGKKTKYDSPIVDYQSILRSNYYVIASKVEIYEFLEWEKENQNLEYELIKGYE